MKKLIIALIVLGLVSCGGGTNNDQGTSFTLLGYAGTEECIAGALPNLAGFSTPLSTDTEPGSFGGGILAGMVLQNNLSRQFIRTENAFFTYFIPGASTQPPATAVPAGVVIPAAGTQVGGGAQPGGGAQTGQTTCVQSFVVSAEVRQWLVLNRAFLPELPFTMEVNGYVTGISQAGDRFDTNEVTFFVQFTPDVVIPPEGVDGEGDEGAGTIEEGESTDGSAVDTDVDSGGGDTGSGDQL